MSSILSNQLEINPINWGLQRISSGLQSISITPIKDFVSYAAPTVRALIDRHVSLTKEDRPLTAMMGGDKIVDSIGNETAKLASAAGIKGEVDIYTSLNASFAGDRGLVHKVITLPLEHIHQRNFSVIAPTEKLLSKKELEENKWAFSNNEMRYLISTSIAEATICPLLKVIARVIVIALIVGLYFTPIQSYVGATSFTTGLALYYGIDRWIGNRVDASARNILKNRFMQDGQDSVSADIQATQTAINTLKKIQIQRLYIRSRSTLCKMMIGANGNVLYDITKPSISKRIRKSEDHLTELLKPKKPKPASYNRSFIGEGFHSLPA